MAVIEKFSEEEAYLWAILQDPSGIDQAEFSWTDQERDDQCFRVWPFQWKWWRCQDRLQIDQCARSVGKSLSIKARAFAFPFVHPGGEMVVTAPEGVHLDAVTDVIETTLTSNRLGYEMLRGGRQSFRHKPFHCNFKNGARIMGRIPQRDGRGVKGCVGEGTLILTSKGHVAVEDLKVGDLVLTHEGRWKSVQAINVDVNDAYEVRGQGSFPLTVSCDHRFYGAENKAGPKAKRNFDQLYFHDIEALIDDRVYWATPTVFPELPVPDTCLDGQNLGLIPTSSVNFWWLVGRWIADGYRSMDRKNNKGRKVHWLVHPSDQKQIFAYLDSLGLRYRIIQREHSSADSIEVASSLFYRYFGEHFGEHPDGKRLPAWALGMATESRTALLEGYLSGDGWFNFDRNRWEVGTASKTLAVGVQLLAQSLGYTVNCTVIRPKPNSMRANPLTSWRLQIGHGYPEEIEDFLVGKVKSVTPVGKVKIYNPIIEDDHSYISGSIVSHNIHPVWLELDEAQDYPDPGWTELNETLKQGTDGAIWRAHGVTRGVRDKFFKYTDDPNSNWKVHRYPAMARPTWSDQEREDKIEQYGGRDDPDYRRNILGKHGDSVSPLFVLHRLMVCIDDDKGSEYNQDEYSFFRINEAYLRETGLDIVQALDFPSRHKNYRRFWAGMDVGFTNHPSEILIFAEHTPKGAELTERKRLGKAIPPDGSYLLKLVTRINLTRVATPDQIRAVLWVVDSYKPEAFSMDKTGNGLPLFQEIQDRNRQTGTIIKGYGFSEKVLVDFDQSIEVDDSMSQEEIAKEAGISRNTVEYATDALRKMVDEQRLWLPWDEDLIGEFQGQTYKITKTVMDQYGKREYSMGKFHALDAARMAILGYKQQAMETLMKKPTEEPVFARFVY